MTTVDGTSASPELPEPRPVAVPPPTSTGGEVILAQIDESFHQVAGGVVHETLLRLGHTVDVRDGPHPAMYPLLGNGDVHLFATSWLPGGHAAYWPQISDQALRVAPLYGGARFYWAVPDYIPADQVASLAHLARPEVAQRMATLVVQGTTPGAGLTTRSLQVVSDYRLDEVGWSYKTGTLADIIRTVDERIAAHEWFVTPLWRPQYLNEVHSLRPLDDPRGVFPAPDTAWLTAHRRAFGQLPDRTQTVLRRIRFTVADATAMDRSVNRAGLGTLEAAQAWMEQHPDHVGRWFA